MSAYHLDAIIHALRSVQFSGQPTEISSCYETRLPNGETLQHLVQQFGLTMKPSKSTGRWIIEKPWSMK